ncbi:MAG: hypothetical protein WCT27_04400 [Patescibacteria group bacterium]|jgi:hypothetical protein
MNKSFEFKNDRYRKNRGGYSRWLLLSCEKCKNKLLIYQKDGPGIIKRLYYDRIGFLAGATHEKNLICNKCKSILGIKTVFQKENRPAYRLFVGAVTKNIIKGPELKKMKLNHKTA